MRRRVVCNSEYCIGCHLCELACLTVHSKSKDLAIAFTKERGEGLTACKEVFQRGPETIALSCKHCDEPECVQACISGALYKDPESGRTEYDPDKCVGCFSCVMACTSGSIKPDPKGHKIIKCDLCPDRDVPACVAACPNMVLTVEEIEDED